MEEKNETFTYTYSAKDREEVKRIRNKYAPPAVEETPLERLRRLDKSATRSAAAIALLLGIAGTLFLGVGMCCTMLPAWARFFIPGIAVGVAGIAGIVAAYPVYTCLVRRKRKKLAPEILRLTEELLK